MDYYLLPVSKPVNFHMTGKFEALSAEWKHAELLLMDYELFVVTKGILYLEYNKKQYRIGEGEMLLLPPVAPPNNLRRGFQSSDCSFYWMHFDYDSFGPIGESITIPEYGRLIHSDKVMILMKQLQDMSRNNVHITTLNYMTSLILCTVSEDLLNQSQNNIEAITQTSSSSQIYEDIIEYINHNIHNKLTVKDIAAHFNYNEKYISHMFAAKAHVTLKEYITERKTEAASFFLTDTNLTIKEIASKLGYSDSHNFTRSYKTATGFTPSSYRNTYSKRIINH
ncbi:MAG: helix-turn-helix domain-containing protein [Lachnospiraceae bacterium]|nr:helix-turn-helix domain-containing protein [Lachnospiraceae bacterium]